MQAIYIQPANVKLFKNKKITENKVITINFIKNNKLWTNDLMKPSLIHHSQKIMNIT